ncbi:MAG TPA: GGDEF domain-containing protein [Povalibacter sp.]|nr:GGDEF domain-containing protein [Povalibacter sp.]
MTEHRPSASEKAPPARPGVRAGRHRRSALGRLVARIFPVLAFSEPLESEFRRWYSEHVRARIGGAMWIPVCSVLLAMLGGGTFSDMRDAVFGNEHETLVNILRFALIVPGCIALMAVTYTDLYAQWFSRVAQVVMPVHALCFIIMDVLMHRHGYSLSSIMPVVVLAPYFVFGMVQAQAVRTVVLIIVMYALGGYFGGLDGGQRAFDLAVVLFAGALGASVHYSLQKSVRNNYLSTQLMSESLNRDALTGIHNRRMFDEHAARMWHQATRVGVPIALLMIDIDHFKAFNDHGGHQAGDACLVKVAEVLNRASRRPLDLTARYGGEEFAILLYDTQRDRVEELCRELHTSLAGLAIAHPAFTNGQPVTFSIGAACVDPQPGRRVEGLIQLADEALYTAKERGRNRTVVMDREYETLNTGAFRVRRRGEEKRLAVSG